MMGFWKRVTSRNARPLSSNVPTMVLPLVAPRSTAKKLLFSIFFMVLKDGIP